MGRRPADGQYRVRIQVLARTLAPKGPNGEEAESWPDSGPAYAAAPDVLTPGELLARGLAASTSFRRLRVKGRAVPVREVDRVKIVATGEVFNVTGVGRDYLTNETLLSLERAALQPPTS